MSELVDFLLARIADDEAEVEARVRWWHDGFGDGESAHAWRPMDSRNWREARAKLLLVEGVREHRKRNPWAAHRPDWFTSDAKWGGDAPYVLRCLALAYADHEDYREEWKP